MGPGSSLPYQAPPTRVPTPETLHPGPLQPHAPACSPRPAGSWWACSGHGHPSGLQGGFQAAPLTRPEGGKGVQSPRRPVTPGVPESCLPRSRSGPKLGPGAPPTAAGGPWQNQARGSAEHVARAGLRTPGRDPKGGPSPAGCHAPRGWERAGLRETRDTFGPKCVTPEPLCMLREIQSMCF